MMTERLKMPDDYSLEKIIPYLETKDDLGEWVRVETAPASSIILESAPRDKSLFYEKWKARLLNPPSLIQKEEFYKEYIGMPAEIRPLSEENMERLKQLRKEVKNLRTYYQWEFVGTEEEEKIQNSWMIQVFLDRLNAFSQLLISQDTGLLLERMRTFIEEHKFYTHSMEKEVAHIEWSVKGEIEKRRMFKGFKIYGSKFDDMFQIPVLKIEEEAAPSHRAIGDLYGGVLQRPTTAFIVHNAGS